MSIPDPYFKRVRYRSSERYPFLDRVIPEASGGERKRCLNLGCGHDEYLRPAIEARGYQYVGVDIDASIKPPILVCGDAHRLPFGDHTFDVILAIAALEHLHSPWEAIQEMSRVAKQGALLFGWVPQLAPFHGDSYFNFTYAGIRRILDLGDFDPVEIRPGGAAGLHFLRCLIAPYRIPHWFKTIIELVYRAILGIRRVAAALYYHLKKGGLEAEARERIGDMLENQALIFTDGLEFTGRKRRAQEN